MSKIGEDTQIVRVEVVPPEDHQHRRMSQAEAEAMVKSLVERQVAEIMAQRDEFVFQPFFAAKRVSDEIKRLQTVPEQRAWARVFEKHGCIVCGRKDLNHASCGCCSRCYGRIDQRKRAATRECEKNSRRDIPACDREAVARKALFGSSTMPALPGAPEMKRTGKRGGR